MWTVYRVDNSRTVAQFGTYLDAEEYVETHQGIAYAIILDYPL